MACSQGKYIAHQNRPFPFPSGLAGDNSFVTIIHAQHKTENFSLATTVLGMSTSSPTTTLPAPLETTRFQQVKEDIEILQNQVRSIRDSDYFTAADFIPVQVGINCYHTRIRAIGRLLQWKWNQSVPTNEDQWRSFWRSFLAAADPLFEAPVNHRLPIETLIACIPQPRSDRGPSEPEDGHLARAVQLKQRDEASRAERRLHASLVHACVDGWETFSAKYAAQMALGTGESRTSSSWIFPSNRPAAGSINSYGTPVDHTIFNRSNHHRTNLSAFGDSIYSSDAVDTLSGYTRGTERRENRGPRLYVDDADRRRHRARTLMRQQGYFSDSSSLGRRAQRRSD
jgi:hypothetical protein